MIPTARLSLVLVLAAAMPQAATPQASKADLDPQHAAKMAKGLALFKQHVRPILAQSCLRCHGGKAVESELDLSNRDRLLKGGQHGPVVVPGKSQDSLLIKHITHQRDPHMPKVGAKLSDAAVAHIKNWIDLGAPYDGSLVVTAAKKKSWTERVLPAEAKHFWSFEPLVRVAPPAGDDHGWCKTPVDRFIFAKLAAAGLAPNARAGKQALIRRAYFDLVGLPPPPEEVEAFLKDSSPEAYARLIDRLLASPQHGERWARHWLDLARFAESHGFEHDYDRPSAYHYRDFVIEALASDLPFDTFVKWQIAGDEFAPDNPLALKATGFLAAGVHSTQITKVEVEKHRYDEMDDKLSTLTTAFLGLTVGCARCHDQKYDPIPQADYYRLLSTFTTTVRSEIDLKRDPADYRREKAAFDREHVPYEDAVRKFEWNELPKRFAANAGRAAQSAPGIPGKVLRVLLAIPPAQRSVEQQAVLLNWYKNTDSAWRALNDKRVAHLAKAPKDTMKCLVATEGLPAVRLHTQGEDFFPQTFFLRRGDPDNKEGVAPQGFLQALMPEGASVQRWQSPPPAGWRTSYRRRALAAWLTDTERGAGQLLARVIVNRLWQHHMGRGIVATPSDFGSRGERPTHPELLDYLAGELIKNGWRLRPIHKLIMTSAVYQQASLVDAEKVKHDRDNKLWWHFPARRLEAEVIRDSLLAVSAQLDERMYGPGTLDESSRRRSVYFTVKRSKLMPMMVIFDAPEALTGMAERPTTTIAPQALHLLNSPQVRQYAHAFARRAAPSEEMPLDEALRRAYRIALAREPSAAELQDGVAFLGQQMATYPPERRRESALADFCQVLMCLNEFVYVD